MKNLLILFLVIGLLIWSAPLLLMIVLSVLSAISSIFGTEKSGTFTILIIIIVVGLLFYLLKPNKK
jgi:uncharacterized membrane-anchored protein